MFSVYQIINSQSGKSYVGWTSKTPEQRFSDHRKCVARGSTTHFYCALRKYPAEAWRLLTIANVETAHEAKRLEQQFIADLKTCDPSRGYNMTTGGDGLHDPSGRVAQKISATLKGRMLGIPKPASFGERMRGRHHRPETLAKMSSSQLLRFSLEPVSIETRQRQSAAKAGKKRRPWSHEHKQLISERITEIWRQKRARNG